MILKEFKISCWMDEKEFVIEIENKGSERIFYILRVYERVNCLVLLRC